MAGTTGSSSWAISSGLVAGVSAYCRSMGSSTLTGPRGAERAWEMAVATTTAMSSADSALPTALDSAASMAG